jgi:hypothetical protein
LAAFLRLQFDRMQEPTPTHSGKALPQVKAQSLLNPAVTRDFDTLAFKKTRFRRFFSNI